jgi:hypothetical protein
LELCLQSAPVYQSGHRSHEAVVRALLHVFSEKSPNLGQNKNYHFSICKSFILFKCSIFLVTNIILWHFMIEAIMISRKSSILPSFSRIAVISPATSEASNVKSKTLFPELSQSCKHLFLFLIFHIPGTKAIL